MPNSGHGIELLANNIAELSGNVLEILAEYLNLHESDELYCAAYCAAAESRAR
jgi:hypothetical protein